uniref:V-SNARE coiled-coil homology domain-containing protein n=1 Tax=Pyramimonas obovata TaxID=1411642 RepID=A0A7S0RX04_9CHLO
MELMFGFDSYKLKEDENPSGSPSRRPNFSDAVPTTGLPTGLTLRFIKQEQVNENERYVPVIGWTSGALLPTERDHLSGGNGNPLLKESLKEHLHLKGDKAEGDNADDRGLPEDGRWRWCTGWKLLLDPDCDIDGWQYATTWPSGSEQWNPEPESTNIVRRRRWIRWREWMGARRSADGGPVEAESRADRTGAVLAVLKADLDMVATVEQRCVMEAGGCETFKEAYDLLANAVLVERIVDAPKSPMPLQTAAGGDASKASPASTLEWQTKHVQEEASRVQTKEISPSSASASPSLADIRADAMVVQEEVQEEAKEFHHIEHAEVAGNTLNEEEEEAYGCLNLGCVAVPDLSAAFGDQQIEQAERHKYTFVKREQVSQNERWAPVFGWTPKSLLPTERGPFSGGAPHAKASLKHWLSDSKQKKGEHVDHAPGAPRWEWCSEWTLIRDANCDEDGWQYATGWPKGKAIWAPKQGRGHLVRRRRWVRWSEWVGGGGTEHRNQLSVGYGMDSVKAMGASHALAVLKANNGLEATVDQQQVLKAGLCQSAEEAKDLLTSAMFVLRAEVGEDPTELYSALWAAEAAAATVPSEEASEGENVEALLDEVEGMMLEIDADSLLEPPSTPRDSQEAVVKQAVTARQEHSVPVVNKQEGRVAAVEEVDVQRTRTSTPEQTMDLSQRDLLLEGASSAAQRQAAAASTADRIRAKYGRPARGEGAGSSGAGSGGAAGEVLSSMHDNQNKLSERGEKLSDIQDKSAQLESDADGFLELAKKLANNQKEKSWGFW